MANPKFPTPSQRAALALIVAAPDRQLVRQAGGFWTRSDATRPASDGSYSWGARDRDYVASGTIAGLIRRGVIVDVGGRAYPTRVRLTGPGMVLADELARLRETEAAIMASSGKVE